jgi:hypothetical protein
VILKKPPVIHMIMIPECSSNGFEKPGAVSEYLLVLIMNIIGTAMHVLTKVGANLFIPSIIKEDGETDDLIRRQGGVPFSWKQTPIWRASRITVVNSYR